MRQIEARQSLASDETARGVQVLDDTNQSFRSPDQIDIATVESAVVTGERLARGTLIADDGVQRTKGADEQQGKPPFLDGLERT
jgi:hypothetical protein